jgi:hypothetical protein
MESERFRDRAESGRLLADRLRHYAGRDDVIVLALPRGGVPVGKALGAPLDVFVVRKLGIPRYEELAMGAIASGGLIVLSPEALLEALPISEADIHRAAAAELRELERREQAYRGGHDSPRTWRARRSSSSTTAWPQARRCAPPRSRSDSCNRRAWWSPFRSPPPRLATTSATSSTRSFAA